MTVVIGPTFPDELKAAGLFGLPFAWGEDGAISGRENLTTQQQTDLDAVIAAHNPNKVTSDDVKSEAYRRIVEIVPEWKQRNLIAQGATLAEKGRANWTAEELAGWDAGQAMWGKVAAIRAASDTIEANPPATRGELVTDNRWPK